MTVLVEKKRRVMVAQRITKRMRGILNLLNLHFAGVALLGLVNLYLLVHMAFAWRQTDSNNAQARADQTVALETAKIAKKPLEGLDEKLAAATKEADKFYTQRLPFADSVLAAELGGLAKKQGVKLTRAQYAYAPVLAGTTGELTEARMDVSLSGDYRPLVLFLNSLERDKVFFMIQALTLTGQQSGTVGLRLKLTTYLRTPVGAEASDKNVIVDKAGEAGSDTAGGSVAGDRTR